MELFSAAGSVYAGREFATANLPRIVLTQPHVSFYGVSTPTRFWEAMGSSYAVDGFLSRWLIFETSDATPARVAPSANSDDLRDLGDMIASIMQQYTVANVPNPVAVPISSYARDLEAVWDDWRNEAVKSGSGHEAVYARGMEHTIKVALCCGDLKQSTLEWAHRLVTKQIEGLINSIETSIFDSRHEKHQQRILLAIRRSGGIMTRKDLFDATRSLTKKERDEAIETLIERGKLDRYRVMGGTKSAVQYQLPDIQH
jgi:hypothetical protein